MSYFTILICKRKDLKIIKEKIFETNNKKREISFELNNESLEDTKSFKDSDKYCLVIIESHYTSFNDKSKDEGNCKFFEGVFMDLLSRKVVYFLGLGYTWVGKGFERFKEKSVKELPEVYEEDTIYIFQNKY